MFFYLNNEQREIIPITGKTPFARTQSGFQRAECQITIVQRTGQSGQVPSFSQWTEYHRMIQVEVPRDKASDKTIKLPAKPQTSQDKGFKR